MQTLNTNSSTHAPVLCVASLLLALACSEASSSDRFAEAERIVRQFSQDSGAPAVCVSIGRHAQQVWSRCHGLADVEQRVPADPARTKFRIGSVAKSITALALVQLVEGGKIGLNDGIEQYLPELPRDDYRFSVGQLAGHLACVRHYAGNEAYSRKRYGSVNEALEIFIYDPLVCAPGTEWKYSSYGYNLLSAVIEKAAGTPFPEHIQESVFLPFGMASTVPDDLEKVVPFRGGYYVRKNGQLFNEPEVDNSNKWASGGILSTTDDLVRFGLALMDDRAVSPAMRELLWTEQVTLTGQPTAYGLGFRIVVDDEGTRWIGHGGGSIGGTTQFWLFPDSGLVIAMASNLTELDYGDVLPRLRKVFVEHPAGSLVSRSPRPHVHVYPHAAPP